MAAKYLLTTLGCKVNQYESQQIRELLESFGLRPAVAGQQADLAVVNTCAVTVSASRKNRQAIRRLSRGGRTPVVVVGCGASADRDRLSELAGVVAVFGHDVDVRSELHALLSKRLDHPSEGSTRRTLPVAGEPFGSRGNEVSMKPEDTTPIPEASTPANPGSPLRIIAPDLPIVKKTDVLLGRIEVFAGHQRAFLKVQDGCDAFCTYCIIPRLRPVLGSKPVEIAVAEAEALVRAGHREIVITGIFLGAYGRTTAIRKRFGGGPSPLATLVAALAEVDGLERLRLSSLEPGDVDASLLEVLTAHPACVPHLHLPLQSGSATILRRMNRQYTSRDFVEMVDRVRRTLDHPAITTDIIVGFPGETERDFEASLAIARHTEFCKIHAFPFSSRDGTAASKWRTEFIAPPVVRERMRRLSELERECSMAFRAPLVGRQERVIVEEAGEDDAAPWPAIRHGRADRYFEVHFEADKSVRAGDLVDVRIDRVTPTRTHATHIDKRSSVYPLYVASNAVAADY